MPQLLFQSVFPHCVPPGCLPAFSPGETLHPLGSISVKPFDLQDPKPCWLQKLWEISPSFFSQPISSGKCSQCAFSCVLLSLLPFSPITASSPPHCLGSHSLLKHLSTLSTFFDVGFSLTLFVEFVLSVFWLIFEVFRMI